MGSLWAELGRVPGQRGRLPTKEDGAPGPREKKGRHPSLGPWLRAGRTAKAPGFEGWDSRVLSA